MLTQLSDDERDKFRRLLRERFPELATDEAMSVTDTIAALGELYLTLAPHEASVDATPDRRGENYLTGQTSVKLARVWAGLEETKARIDNEIVPLGMHLGLDDPELMIALETLSEKIGKHFDSFKLVAEPRHRRR